MKGPHALCRSKNKEDIGPQSSSVLYINKFSETQLLWIQYNPHKKLQNPRWVPKKKKKYCVQGVGGVAVEGGYRGGTPIQKKIGVIFLNLCKG